MENNIPGSSLPPETISGEELNKIAFSYRELVIDDSYFEDGVHYLRFFVDKDLEEGQNTFYIEVKKEEFLEYQELFFKKMDEQLSANLNDDDICYPKFKKVDTFTTTFTLSLEEGQQFEEQVVSDIYRVTKLKKSFKIGINN